MSNRRRASANAPGGSLPDIVAELAADGHLQPRLVRAGQMLVAALQTAHGNSAGLVSNATEKVDSTRTGRLRPTGGPSTNFLDRLTKPLRQHERELFRHMVVSPERGAVLTAYGKSRSGYTTSRTSRAFAAGAVYGLLCTVAEVLDNG